MRPDDQSSTPFVLLHATHDMLVQPVHIGLESRVICRAMRRKTSNTPAPSYAYADVCVYFGAPQTVMHAKLQPAEMRSGVRGPAQSRVPNHLSICRAHRAGLLRPASALSISRGFIRASRLRCWGAPAAACARRALRTGGGKVCLVQVATQNSTDVADPGLRVEAARLHGDCNERLALLHAGILPLLEAVVALIRRFHLSQQGAHRGTTGGRTSDQQRRPAATALPKGPRDAVKRQGTGPSIMLRAVVTFCK